jgi:hypothetical protein
MYCGEPLQPERFTFWHVVKSIPGVFFHLGEDSFYTIFSLLRHPGHMIREYFIGNRRRHYKPINFFLFTAGLVLLLFLTFHIHGTEESSAVYTSLLKDKELGKKLDAFNDKSLTLIVFFQFPIVALFTWLFFRSRKYYFGEHLVANAYIIGEVLLAKILLFPAYLIFNGTDTIEILDDIYAGLVVVYYTYAFYDWLYYRKTWKGFFISLAFVVIVYIIVMLITLFLIPVLYSIKVSLFGG